MNTIKKIFQNETTSSLVLAFAAILVFIIANSGFYEVYKSILEFKIIGLTVKYWINDALMAIFFFVIGLEIKKELLVGELSNPKKASLPVIAALGGMAIPALIYASINWGQTTLSGWGIPMATDIAFALGVLSLFSKKVPSTFKIFLLAVAIVDDLGAVLTIAFFYTAEIKGAFLALAFAALGLAFLLKQSGVRSYFVYVLVGAIVWFGFLKSGVHATIAGVLLGLLTPLHYPKARKSQETYSPLEDLVHLLHPWVAFAIMPIFAFANAGILLEGIGPNDIISSNVSIGIILGLCLGKPIGILGFSFISIKLGLANMPKGMTWYYMLALSCLAGIGFTMSIFISGLALDSNYDSFSKMGIILASLISGIVGSLLLTIKKA